MVQRSRSFIDAGRLNVGRPTLANGEVKVVAKVDVKQIPIARVVVRQGRRQTC